ncbi:MAG: sugar ABC transporter permease [Candidatus Eremiobacteraeota bacterium]|nr:sugar ABC transporter permease [Candidatus Eremiobacteraeota bacterium]
MRTSIGSKAGWVFTLPYLAFIAVFLAYPIAFALYLVFVRWDLIAAPQFVGLANVRYLLQDREFWQALLNTFVFLCVNVPLQIAAALAIALALAQPIALRGFFRAAFFVPVVISVAVVSLLWQQVYNTDNGLLNALLRAAGLPAVAWLTDPHVAMPAIAGMVAWKNVGLYVLFFLGGILAVPPQLYEAAKLEGASPWQEFRYVTLPLVRPAMFLVVVLSTIAGFNLFIEPYVMTGGGPLESTLSVVLYMYKHAFSFLDMGYAATVGVALALIVLAVVSLERRLLEDRGA